MKNNLLNTFAIMMLFNITAQDKVYDEKGNSHTVTESMEKLILESNDAVQFDKLEEKDTKEMSSAGLIATLAPIAIDAIFTSVEKYLEKREKSFVGEYATSNSYLDFAKKDMPLIRFTRTGKFNNSSVSLIDLTINSIQPDPEYPLAFFLR